MGWNCSVPCPSEASGFCVAGGIGACFNGELCGAIGLRGRVLAVVLSGWCCAWLSMVCCGLAEEEWEDSGDAVGSCAPCCCPGDALFDLLLAQALFGGGGGGAMGRGIEAAIETGSS